MEKTTITFKGTHPFMREKRERRIEVFFGRG